MAESVNTSALVKRGGSISRAIRQSPGAFFAQALVGSALIIAGLAFLTGSVGNWFGVFTGHKLDGEALSTGDTAAAMIPAIGLLFFAGITLGLGIYLFRRYFVRAFATARMARFAEMNRWEFLGTKPGPRYQASVFLIGADARVHRDLVKGQLGGRNVEFGDFLATVEHKRRGSSTKKTSVVASFGYVAIDLGVTAPKFILDSVRDGALRRGVAGYDRYDLEGDFPDHFTTLMPEGTERDMLELLTPDVMAVFSDYGQDFDFEVIGTLLVIVANKRSVSHPSTVDGILAAAEKIVPAVRNKALRNTPR